MSMSLWDVYALPTRPGPAFPWLPPPLFRHCSLLVKPVRGAHGDKPVDLMFAHTAWFGYETMTRIYKRYDFPLTLDGTSGVVPATSIAFSSYPAAVFSYDDWLMTSAGLGISETTIENNNATLWQFVTPSSVLEWARSMVATRLATTGQQWTSIFSQYNSGYGGACLFTSPAAVHMQPVSQRVHPEHAVCYVCAVAAVCAVRVMFRTYNNQWNIVDFKVRRTSGVCVCRACACPPRQVLYRRTPPLAINLARPPPPLPPCARTGVHPR
jgi:hypothetical protein